MANVNYTSINSDNDMMTTGLLSYSVISIDASSNDITITLPINLSLCYKFFRIDTSTYNVTFNCQTGDTINNSTTYSLSMSNAMEIYYMGTNWDVFKYNLI